MNLFQTSFLTLACFLVHVLLVGAPPPGPADFGDLPDTSTPSATITYQTRIVDNGPWHLVGMGSQIYLGTHLPDPESDGQPSLMADQDDLNGNPDDEDGVLFPATIQAGKTINITVNATNATTSNAFLHTLIDWSGDGNFVGSTEIDVTTITPGTINAPISIAMAVPLLAETTRPIGARFRIASIALDPDDPATDGEIEDFMIQVQAADLDLGDLPDSSVGASPAYATRLIDNGPSHALDSRLFLGASVPDLEPDGQPHINALGDDNTDTDDEEKLSPLSGIQAGTTATFTHEVANYTASDVWLHGFFDWNGDGDFLDSNEHAKTAVPPNTMPTTESLMVAVPVGYTYTDPVAVRIRLSSLPGLLSEGHSPDGEVEDYFIDVEPALDFGDLPDIASGTASGDFDTTPPDYETLLANDGPRHLIIPELALVNDTGSADADIDGETDAYQSAAADGDDTNGDNDELQLFFALTRQITNLEGATRCEDIRFDIEIALGHFVKNDTGSDATLYFFIDWNRDGDFDDVDEQWSQIVPTGTNGEISQLATTTIAWPGVDFWDETWAVRTRLSTDSGLNALGYAPDGEVQDDLITATFAVEDLCSLLTTLDFGDLPDASAGTASGDFDTTIPDYETLSVNDGPRHTIDLDLVLGNNTGSGDADIDHEGNGQPTASADGDDINDENDEIDMLYVLSGLSVDVGEAPDFDVFYTPTIIVSHYVKNNKDVDATLYSFIDWNQDGDFDDTDESWSQIVPAGTNAGVLQEMSTTLAWEGSLSWTKTWALRTRLSTDTGLGATGYATDGEVEDHLLTFDFIISDPTPNVLSTVDFGDLPDKCPGTLAGNFNRGPSIPDYRTRLADNGPRHTVIAGLSFPNDTSSADTDVDTEVDGQPTAAADGDDTDGNNDELTLLTALSGQRFIAATPVDHSKLELDIFTSVSVENTTGQPATVYGFIDGDSDGDFTSVGESQTQIIPGDGSTTFVTFTFTVTIPWPGELNWDESFALRFRISSDSGLDAHGPATDGEVEDYVISLNLAIADPRPASETRSFLEFDSLVGTLGNELPFGGSLTDIGFNATFNEVWSINGELLEEGPTSLSPSQLAQYGPGSFALVVTFEDSEGNLYTGRQDVVLRELVSFETWIGEYGLTGTDALPLSDSDGDGLTALEEFAFGSIPILSSSQPMQVIGTILVAGEEWLTLSYLRRTGGIDQLNARYLADGILYAGESSLTLESWPTPAVAIPAASSLPAAPFGYEWATIRTTTPINVGDRDFLRVKADLK